MNRLYLRISTDQQIQERQEFILKQNGYTEQNSLVYKETFSGKSTKNRPVLKDLLEQIQPNDKLIVTDLSRLARSVKDLWEIVETLNKKNAVLVSIKENLDLSTSTGKLMFTIIGAMYQFERDTLSDRTKEALAAKKAKGVRLGRPNVFKKELIEEAIIYYKANKCTYKDIEDKFGISAASFCLKMKKHKEAV